MEEEAVMDVEEIITKEVLNIFIDSMVKEKMDELTEEEKKVLSGGPLRQKKISNQCC